jgi:hypothetical protein
MLIFVLYNKKKIHRAILNKLIMLICIILLYIENLILICER